MDVILINTMSTGLYNSIKYFLFNKKDKNIIIDPLSCIIKLGLLSYQGEGTKISIIDNQINFNEPNIGQGLIRYIYGDGREDLHNLFKPIQKSVEWYKLKEYADIDFLFQRAIAGMNILKKSYGKYETIQHTIDYYISILNGTIASTHFVNNQYELSTVNSEIINNQSLNNRNIEHDNCNNSNQTNYNVSSNYSKNNNSPKNKKYHSKEALQQLDDTSTNTSYVNNNNNNNNNNNHNQSEKGKPKINDLERFLKNLWSKEEIHIVINLFKEFNNKDGEEDQKFIFDSIINYCMMKENKLHIYIKEKSSILE